MRTEYSWIDKVLKTIDEINIGLGWKKVASVDLKVKPSSGFRVWSKKQIDPIVHTGNWKVVISTASNPNTKLCIAKFVVK